MATYEIKSPDGQTWEVNAPDDATEQQVMAYAQSQWEPTRPAGGGRGFVQPPAASDTQGNRLREMQDPNLSRVEKQNLADAWTQNEMARLADINPGASLDNLAGLAAQRFQAVKDAAPAPLVDRVSEYLNKPGSNYDLESAKANAKFDEGVERRFNLSQQSRAPDAKGDRVAIGYNPVEDAQKTARDTQELADLRDDALGRVASGEMNSAVRGMVKGGVQSAGLTAATVGYLADVVGADAVKQWGLDTNNAATRIANQMTLAKTASQIQNLDDFQGWFAENGGYVAYQAAEALLTGGLVSGMSKQAARQAAIEATALGMNNLRQTLGSVYAEAVDESKRTGKDPSLLGVALGAVGSAAIDTVADKFGLDAMTKTGFKGAVAERMAKSLGSQALMQGGTEALQLVPEEMGAGRDPFRDGMGAQFFDEAAVGALGGGGGPGVLGGLNKYQAPTGPSAEDIARSKGFLTPAPIVAPRVEDMPTTPTVPTVQPSAQNVVNNIASLLGQQTPAPNAGAAPAVEAPTVQPPVSGVPGQTDVATTEPVSNTTQPAVDGAAPVPAATALSNPAPMVPAGTDPRQAALARAEDAAQLEQEKANAAEVYQGLQRERAQKERASTGSNYQQTSATPTPQPGAVPQTQLAQRMVKLAMDRWNKNQDLTDSKTYPEAVLYGIINSPDVGADLLTAARQELGRRRGTNSQPTVSTSTTLSGTTSLGVGGQAPRVSSQQSTVTGTEPGNPVGQSQQSGPTDVAPAPAVGSNPPAQSSRGLVLAPKTPIKRFYLTRDGVQAQRPGLKVVLSQQPMNEDQKVASAFARVIGGTFTLVENEGTGDMPNGFVDGYAGRNFYLDAKSTHAPLIVVVHEGVHGLPEHIRAPLIKALNDMAPAKAKQEFLKRYGYSKLAASDRAEEVGAYMAQLSAQRPGFWEELRTKMGNKDFSALAAHILNKFKELAGLLKDKGDDTFLDRHFNQGEIAKMRSLVTDAYAQSMREQGMKPDETLVSPAMSNKPVETKQDSVEDQDGEPDDSRATIEQGDVPESVDEQATLDSTLRLAKSKVWNKGRDLKVAIQEAVQAAAQAAGIDVGAPSEATTKYLTRVGVKDALTAMKQNANAVGWYDVKTRQALAVMSLVHPELAHDENARFAMVWAMAVTSNGLKVGKNFEIAEKVYREYKRTGAMPANLGIGNAAKAINQSLALFNELKAEWGLDNLRKFMLTNFTVKEITGIRKDLKPGGEHADVTVKGAAILGPKIGNGFFSNLYGNFDALTMDRWLIRTWGRWGGTLISPLVKQTAKARERLQANLDAIVKDPDEAKRLGDAIDLPITAETPLEDLANAVQKASMEPATRKVMNTTETGEELRKAGNGLAKYLDGQKEAPAGPTERKYIRQVFAGILSELRKTPEYKDLTMADLQAVLWYAEKRLYETAKEDPSSEDVEGYNDTEAPDYANAAAAVALEAGISKRRIDNALDREKQNGRTRATRLSDESAQGEQTGVGQPAAAGGFADQQKRRFIATRAIERIRSNRVSDEESSWSYTRNSGTDGTGVRLLKTNKKLGVKYVAEWSLGQKAKNVLKANNGKNSKGLETLRAPKYLELAPGDTESAQAFADAITASKQGGAFGASVYVYPVESSADETGYKDMRLLLSEDGKAGVAVKKNGDIVSVFGGNGEGHANMELALAAGGRKLDCFETILPDFYAPHGFKAVSRIKWNDDAADPAWDKKAFAAFNGGEPDVVFMVYDPEYTGEYSHKDGRLFTGDDAYMEAGAAQDRAMRKIGKNLPPAPAFSNKAQDLDQDITLEIPIEGGKTAKLTVNAASYIKQLDAREEALKMVKECMV